MIYRSLFLLGALACGFTSCASVQGIVNPNGAMEGKVEELASLRTELEASWGQVENRVSEAEQEVSAFELAQTQANVEHLTLVQKAIQARIDTTGVTLDDAAAAAQITEASFTGASAEMQAELNHLSQTGLRITETIHTDLPQDLEVVVSKAKAVVVKAGTIQASAIALRESADKNFLMSDAGKAQFDAKMVRLDSEMEQLKALSATILTDAKGLGTRITGITGQFESKLKAMQ